MDLSIIIVSYNTEELLKNCLFSIEANKQGVNLEVFVVDNASADGSSEMVKSEFPWVKLLKNQKNLGFSKANNQAIRESKGEFVLLLNSDTQVKENSLLKLINFGESNSEAGVVGARLLNSDGTIQPSAYHLPTIRRAIAEFWFGKKGTFEKFAISGNNPQRVEAVVGAAMLISKKTLDKIGLLDERFFMYFEDLDYCRRVSRAGLKIYYLPEAAIVHFHGQSSQKIGSKANQYLVESSKIYHGVVAYFIISSIIRISQVWEKNFKS